MNLTKHICPLVVNRVQFMDRWVFCQQSENNWLTFKDMEYLFFDGDKNSCKKEQLTIKTFLDLRFYFDCASNNLL